MTSIKTFFNTSCIKINNVAEKNRCISSDNKLHIVMKKLELEENKCKLLQKKLDNIKMNKKNSLIKIHKSVKSDKEKTRMKIDDLEKKIKNLYLYINNINISKQNISRKNKELTNIIKLLLPKTDISNECKICYDNKIDCILPCGHTYCSNCISNMNIHNNTDCCFCRKHISNVYKI